MLFDVDDTLVDHTGAVLAGFRSHVREVAPDTDCDAAAAEWHRLEEQHYPRYLAGELTWEGQRRARVRDAVAWLGLPPLGSEAAEDAWFDAYRVAFDAATAVFADTLDALDALGVPTGVVSNNATANLLAKLERVGLGGRFDVVLCPSEGGLPAKPHPEAFLAGCAALGVPAGTTAYVGDRLRTDAVGARDAGLIGVWLDRTHPSRTPDETSRALPDGVVRIGSLAELPALVGQRPRR